MFYTNSDLIIIILNHNPATLVQASILSSWDRIRSTFFYKKRNNVFALLLKEASLHDIYSQGNLWRTCLMVALGFNANFFVQS